MFGVLDLETSFEGCRFAIGIRNVNNKWFRLACTVGLRVFVCHNLAFRGDYSPVLAKHSKHFSLEDALSIGVDRMQRNFEPMRRQVESWQAEELSAEAAKLTTCQTARLVKLKRLPERFLTSWPVSLSVPFCCW
jgi:hypothetical protein